MGQLTATRIKTLTEPGRYIDGDGLMMEIAHDGSRSWKLRVRVDGKRRDLGLGSLSIVTLTEAREKAREYRRLIAQDIDPVAEKREEKIVIPTFRAAAEQVHAEHKASWKIGKHQVQWITTLETYAYPFMGDRLVNDIEGPQICKALLPIWLSKPETARRVRQRIGAVLDWAYVNGLRDSEAPMRSLSKGLPDDFNYRPNPTGQSPCQEYLH